MEPLSIISLISLVFSVIATGAEMAITQHQNNQNIQLQQDTLHQQQEYATQAAQTANATTVEQYNMLYSPAARRRQLEDANLSVGLMYGGGGSFGQGSTAAQAATPATSLPYMNPLLQPGQMGNVMNALKTITEAENTQKNTEKTDEEIKNLSKVREQIDQAIEQSKAEVKLIEKKCDTEVSTKTLTETQNRLAEIDEQWKTADWTQRIQLTDKQMELIDKQMEKMDQEIFGQEISNNNAQKLYDATLKNMYAQTAKAIADTQLTYAQTEVEKAKKILTEKQAELTDQQKKEINAKIKETEANIKKITKECDVLSDEHTDNWWKFRSYKALGYNQTNHAASGLLGPLVEGAKGLGEMIGDLFN